MRWPAFSLLMTAAFDWPVPWLDRLGVAAAGLAWLALAVAPPRPRLRRARPFPIAPRTIELPPEPDDDDPDLVERIGAYGMAAKLSP